MPVPGPEWESLEKGREAEPCHHDDAFDDGENDADASLRRMAFPGGARYPVEKPTWKS